MHDFFQFLVILEFQYWEISKSTKNQLKHWIPFYIVELSHHSNQIESYLFFPKKKMFR